jgi:hypothetical protein
VPLHRSDDAKDRENDGVKLYKAMICYAIRMDPVGV